MFRHVVMFRFAEDLDAAHIASVAAGLDALPREIPEIRRYVHGADLGVSDGTFDYAVVADFDNEDDFLTYRNHPAHQQFIADCIAGKAIDRAAVQHSTEE